MCAREGGGFARRAGFFPLGDSRGAPGAGRAGRGASTAPRRPTAAPATRRARTVGRGAAAARRPWRTKPCCLCHVAPSLNTCHPHRWLPLAGGQQDEWTVVPTAEPRCPAAAAAARCGKLHAARLGRSVHARRVHRHASQPPLWLRMPRLSAAVSADWLAALPAVPDHAAIPMLHDRTLLGDGLLRRLWLHQPLVLRSLRGQLDGRRIRIST